MLEGGRPGAGRCRVQPESGITARPGPSLLVPLGSRPSPAELQLAPLDTYLLWPLRPLSGCHGPRRRPMGLRGEGARLAPAPRVDPARCWLLQPGAGGNRAARVRAAAHQRAAAGRHQVSPRAVHGALPGGWGPGLRRAAQSRHPLSPPSAGQAARSTLAATDPAIVRHRRIWPINLLGGGIPAYILSLLLSLAWAR